MLRSGRRTGCLPLAREPWVGHLLKTSKTSTSLVFALIPCRVNPEALQRPKGPLQCAPPCPLWPHATLSPSPSPLRLTEGPLPCLSPEAPRVPTAPPDTVTCWSPLSVIVFLGRGKRAVCPPRVPSSGGWHPVQARSTFCWVFSSPGWTPSPMQTPSWGLSMGHGRAWVSGPAGQVTDKDAFKCQL